MLTQTFFNQDACLVAQALIGKVIRRRYNSMWLSARIIESEAYYLAEKGSHASLGFTDKRKALFMPAGTVYMYYARGGHSLNVSVAGEGNAVLIKSGFPFTDRLSGTDTLETMQSFHPLTKDVSIRPVHTLCAGQTLLCRSLQIRVPEWDQRQFDGNELYIEDTGITPESVIQTSRLGIPKGRDEHLMYRFIDHEYARYCTRNPLTRRGWQKDRDYYIVGTKTS